MLEAIFQVIVQSMIFIGGTITAVNSLSENPFDRNNPKSFYQAWKNANPEKDARAWPFLLSLPISLVIHIIVMTLYEVGFFIFYRNHGAYDGLEAHTLALFSMILAYVIYTFCVVIILATLGRSNVFFVQLLGLYFSVLGVILLFGVNSLSANAFWFIPFLAWQAFLAVKTFLENYQKHD
ncbi:MAG: hypothetical protein BVN35_17860 [Proteobacteria bacterium ST_bin11]|nr:MAG: hypothetical protein BVN35_17860 [Proteobacteria bacterium ST_bin11]